MSNKQITFLLDTTIVNRQHSHTMILFSILRWAIKIVLTSTFGP